MDHAIATNHDARAVHQTMSCYGKGRKDMLKTFARLTGMAAIVSCLGGGTSLPAALAQAHRLRRGLYGGHCHQRQR